MEFQGLPPSHNSISKGVGIVRENPIHPCPVVQRSGAASRLPFRRSRWSKNPNRPHSLLIGFQQELPEMGQRPTENKDFPHVLRVLGAFSGKCLTNLSKLFKTEPTIWQGTGEIPNLDPFGMCG